MIFELGHVPIVDGYGEDLLPLALCKQHLAIAADEDEFDELVEVLRDASIEFVERYCSIKLGPTIGMEWRAQAFPCASQRIDLGVWPVGSIDAVEWYDGDGEPVTGAAADYRVTERGAVRPLIGGAWPSAVGGEVVVTFSAGFPAGEAPKALLQACRLMLGHLFRDREAVIIGTIAGEVPLGVAALCGPFRLIVI